MKIWQWCESKNIEIFASYIPTLGQPTIDLFASRINCKCKIYISWGPDPDSDHVDAFTISWKNEFFYAFPPFPLINKIIDKIIREKTEGILSVPKWPSQPWLLLFSKLLVKELFYLSPQKNLILSPLSKPHPLHKNLTLVARRLSGELGQKGTYQNEP